MSPKPKNDDNNQQDNEKADVTEYLNWLDDILNTAPDKATKLVDASPGITEQEESNALDEEQEQPQKKLKTENSHRKKPQRPIRVYDQIMKREGLLKQAEQVVQPKPSSGLHENKIKKNRKLQMNVNSSTKPRRYEIKALSKIDRQKEQEVYEIMLREKEKTRQDDSKTISEKPRKKGI